MEEEEEEEGTLFCHSDEVVEVVAVAVRRCDANHRELDLGSWTLAEVSVSTQWATVPAVMALSRPILDTNRVACCCWVVAENEEEASLLSFIFVSHPPPVPIFKRILGSNPVIDIFSPGCALCYERKSAKKKREKE